MVAWSSRQTRRQWIRLLAGGCLAVVPAVVPPRVLALRNWCRTDPVVKIDGQIAHIMVAADVRHRRAARRLSTGPIRVVVTIPAGISYQYLRSDNGFGYGYDVSLVESAELVATAKVVPVHVAVTAPMSQDTIAVMSYLEPKGRGRLRPGEGYGTANVEFGYTAT